MRLPRLTWVLRKAVEAEADELRAIARRLVLTWLDPNTTTLEMHRVVMDLDDALRRTREREAERDGEG